MFENDHFDMYEPDIDKQPKYTSDVENAYIQSLRGQYYKGCANPLSGRSGTKAYFILENPKRSEVNLFLNKTIHSNLGEIPLIIRTFNCGIIYGGNLRESNCLSNANSNLCYKQPRGRILYGTEVNMSGEKCDYIFTVPKYESFKGAPKGSIIIAPGKAYIAEVCPLIEDANFAGVCSFGWWEERIDYNCCCD